MKSTTAMWLVVLAIPWIACAGSQTDSKEKSTDTSTSEPVATETESPTDTEAVAETDSPTDTEVVAETDSPTDTEVATETETETGTEAETETGTGTGTDSGTDSETACKEEGASRCGIFVVEQCKNKAWQIADNCVAKGLYCSEQGGVPECVDLPGPCWAEPPAGSALPDPLPKYAGECPTLVAGTNTIDSGVADRAFLLAVPENLEPDEKLPVIFLWHWMGAEGASFMERGEVQDAINVERFLAVAPESKDDSFWNWPFTTVDTPARMEEEARFFDNMLACLAEQFNVIPSCVSSVGVSAGGLWTSQLAQKRARRLSSFISISGGVGAPGEPLIPARGWTGADRALPAMVMWGGPADWCVMSYPVTSKYLEAGLIKSGHFFLECIHNCKHSTPPMVPPPGESAFIGLWRFVLDHPYWLPEGQSPYLTQALPEAIPAWCGLGKGSAKIRTGPCEGGILGECSP